jgi:hypothetical protein
VDGRGEHAVSGLAAGSDRMATTMMQAIDVIQETFKEVRASAT